MKFSVIHFHKQLEISGMPQSNRYLLTAQEGFSLELDEATNGVIAKHATLKHALWFPAVSIAMGTIEPEAGGAEEPAPKPKGKRAA